MTCKRRFSDTKFCLQNPSTHLTPILGPRKTMSVLSVIPT